MMRDRVMLLAVLTVAWMLLWGDLSIANLLGGIAAGCVVLAMTPGSRLPRARRVRPVALARFLIRFLVDLVVASLTVAVQVFWSRDRLHPQVVPVHLNTRDETILTLVANTITLTPGTLTLQVHPEQASLLVHALHSDDGGAAVVESARTYERLIRAALPDPRR